MTEEKIQRINELYHKSKGEGLTEAEKEEQAKLRKEYINDIKGSIAAQMKNVNIIEKDGSIVNAAEQMEKKKGNKGE
ncbi:MAG: DUF896 domain-containing protein [Lachnospiraceae bacterium]|nr:DUF896 domain-containing protein [Lachnospiraceae bacterium]